MAAPTGGGNRRAPPTASLRGAVRAAGAGTGAPRVRHLLHGRHTPEEASAHASFSGIGKM